MRSSLVGIWCLPLPISAHTGSRTVTTRLYVYREAADVCQYQNIQTIYWKRDSGRCLCRTLLHGAETIDRLLSVRTAVYSLEVRICPSGFSPHL